MGDIPSVNSRIQNTNLHLNKFLQPNEQNLDNINIPKQPVSSVYKRYQIKLNNISELLF